jgi:tetratricopeptide (TPR) repeat protein
MAPLLLRPSPLLGFSSWFAPSVAAPGSGAQFPFADVRLVPHYPARSPLEDVLRRIPPGSDEYVTEKYAFEIEQILWQWSDTFRASPRNLSTISKFLHPTFEASGFALAQQDSLRSGFGIDVVRNRFKTDLIPSAEPFLHKMDMWMQSLTQIETAEFQIVAINQIASNPFDVKTEVRFDMVGDRSDGRREEHIGSWRIDWIQDAPQSWKVRRWKALEETVALVNQPSFLNVTAQAFAGTPSYAEQLQRGADYWRTVLDGACGIDVYGNNGVAAGDYDNDGFDDLYICQPAGLPNRLYRNRGDGTFEDVTEKAGVGVLDGTACALFADFSNRGHQDLLVVSGAGPLLFVNNGNGSFSLKRDAFKFNTPPQGSFTHAAIADYDRDGRLDIYFCVYSYYLGLDQYHYPVPYFDARNGPPNFLFHNEGNWTFEDRTEVAGLSVENNRYSFACAWGESSSSGLPDLYVANDFGRSNLYRNNGDGTFTAVSSAAHVDDAGAGMSASWSDTANNGRNDIYAANMWSAAGQRISMQSPFHESSTTEMRALYRKHARGNSLYRNQGNGLFQNVAEQAGVEMGRWSWCSDFWDFDHDGYPDLYVANGYISAPNRNDLGSFFWRQVVAKSPDDATPAPAYERGWQALNELIRADGSWSGYERNVMFANNRDGTFSEVSGAVGLDFPEDGRSFALADLDHDGRLEVILKNRNAPQLRILRNAMPEIGHSIAFCLRGTKSNRDAIGATIRIEAGPLRQSRHLQAGSGFLAQHSKEVFFGLGNIENPIRVVVRWPSGLSQTFDNVPVNHRIQIEEGAATITATAFSSTSSAYTRAIAQPRLEPLPLQVETWLIEPLKAPLFSLPDLTGNQQTLRSFQGSFVLLNFWATSAPLSLEVLRELNRSKASLAAIRLIVLALNVDDESEAEQAKAFAAREVLQFPVLFANQEVAGVYNIIYRYLFDRRRDLAIPTSFLLDEQGRIVKIYQGPINPDSVIADVKATPTDPSARLHRALPQGGVLCQANFQRNEFTYGVAMFQHGYLEQAAESFEQVIAARPDDPEGYYNLGTLSLRRSDLDQARTYLEKTVQLRPNYPEAWNNLGMIAAQQGHPDEAVQDFQLSLSLRPDYAVALLNLGNVYRRQGFADKAHECLARALELQPDDAEINYSLGMLYAQRNDLPSASQYLRKAIELRPEYPEALNNLGVIAVREHDYANAEERFKTGILVAPNFDQSYMNLARLYAMQDNTAKAREVLQQLLALQPGNKQASQALELLR